MLCSYGCGQEARFQLKSGRDCCSKSWNSCPTNRLKNSNGHYDTNGAQQQRDYKAAYDAIPDEVKKRMAWSKGLTQEKCPSLARPNAPSGRRFKHTEEFKRWQSKRQSNFLKNLKDRSRFLRKRSWLEETFEAYLNEKEVQGWKAESHFWNEELNRNYFVDFLFAESKLIIELDGTQHKWTVKEDAIRDDWFRSLGYKVVRITHREFVERYFSKRGFLDLIAPIGELV